MSAPPRLLLILCALSAQAVAADAPGAPPGDELEDPAPPRRENAPPRAGADDPGPDVKPDLSILDAWKPDETAPGSSTAPPPTVAPKWKPPTGSDPQLQARKAFNAQMAKVDSALAHRHYDVAQEALEPVRELMPLVSPREVQRLAQTQAKLALSLQDERALVRAVGAWLHACGPEAVDACRKRALAVMTSTQYPEPGRARARKLAEATAKMDACVLSAESAGQRSLPMPGCLDEAAAGYRRSGKGGDRLMLTRIHLARANGLRAKSPSDALTQYRTAARTCEEDRCAELRKRALQSALPLYAQSNNVRAAAHAALQAQAIAATRLPAPQRLYGRTPDVDRTCEALDAADGPGSCRTLEKSLQGHYTFRDFSKGQTPGQGLPAETVQKVNAHYGVLIEECLSRQKHREQSPESQAYRVRWTVRNDGQVEQVHLDKKDLDDGPLADCLREAFTLFRYPRYKGELQHVEQSFMVRVVERTTR